MITFKKHLSNSKGTSTLEATLLMPLIMFFILGLVFFSMFLYQKLVTLDTVVYVAKQRATTWDNSQKAQEDGFLTNSSDDGLYWRIFDDFPDSDLVKESKLKDSQAFIRQKLTSGFNRSETPPQIDVAFENQIFRRSVTVGVTEHVVMPINWSFNGLGPEVRAVAKADVAEPVEFIRNVELAEKYTGKILKSILDMFRNPQKASSKSRPVVASVASDSNGTKIYHYPNCFHIKRIKENNFIQFDSPEAAEKAGFHLCLHCAGRLAK